MPVEGVYKNFLEWFVTFRSPKELYDEQASYLVLEYITIACALLCLMHAFRNGGRHLHLWMAVIFHSWFVECVTYWMPDIDNFWHAQTTIIFLGQRFPLYIMAFYVVCMYISHVAASRLRLPWWALPACVALLDPLVDVPYDIMGIKLIWWTWHDTDPGIFDRHYWVPWTSYYFHASFDVGFAINFYGIHYLLSGKNRLEHAGAAKEWITTLLTACLSMPLGVVQFMLLHHPVHEAAGCHSEISVLMLFAIYGIIFWIGDRHPKPEGRTNETKSKAWLGWVDEVAVAITLWYTFYIALINWGSPRPEDIRATGLHEQTGPCNETKELMTAAGPMTRRKYLCVTDYNEGTMDFHCLPGGKPPPDYSSWYTLCGTPYPNYAEYRIVVTTFSLLGLVVFWQLLARSGRQVKQANVIGMAKKSK